MLQSDCSISRPSGFRIIASVVSVCKWSVTKIDLQRSFRQTVQAERDVYGPPQMERAYRGKSLWLLLTASYGLINGNAKWKIRSDAALYKKGLLSITIIPQHFNLNDRNGNAFSALAKIVDEFVIHGDTPTVVNVVETFQKFFRLGTVTCRPGVLCYFELNTLQHVDYTVTIDGDDKFNAIGTPCLLAPDTVNNMIFYPQLDKRLCLHNGSVAWLGINTSPFCLLLQVCLSSFSHSYCRYSMQSISFPQSAAKAWTSITLQQTS